MIDVAPPLKKISPPAVESIPRLALTPDEAAQAIGLSRRSLDDLMHDPASGFPVLRVGRRCLIPVNELRAWLARAAEA